jgi:hypothetical protein
LPNIASCREAGAASGDALRIGLVRRFDDAPDSATPVRFSFAVRHDERILDVRLQAPDGPLGTRNYRIALQAIPVAGGKSFLHLRYSYEYGWAARLAAQAYLAGAGSGKRGFSVTGEDANGRPRYVDGLRGAVERNAMRCYLAIEAYLGSAQLAAGDRFAASLKQWADAIAQYPRQLREDDIDAYVAAKQAAYRDQRNAVGAGSPSMRRQDFSR